MQPRCCRVTVQMSSNPSLLEVQRALHRAIVDGDKEVLQAILASDSMAIFNAIDIYRNTIRYTLVRAMRLSYPVVQKLVGEEFFEDTIEHFLRQHWPHSACLDDFGSEFAQFLESFEPASGLTYLADVARLEWAVHRALHAPQVPVLQLQRLTQLETDQCAFVCFAANPSLHLTIVDTPADVIWRAVLEQDERALASIEVTRAPRYLLVQRSQDGGAEVSCMAEGEWRFLRALSLGDVLEQALEELRKSAPASDLDRVLAHHLAAGRFCDFSLKTPDTDSAALRILS